MVKFEYKILEIPVGGFWGGRINTQEVADKLNELGRQGWDVISSVDTNMWRGASRNLIVILKRIIEN